MPLNPDPQLPLLAQGWAISRTHSSADAPQSQPTAPSALPAFSILTQIARPLSALAPSTFWMQHLAHSGCSWKQIGSSLARVESYQLLPASGPWWNEFSRSQAGLVWSSGESTSVGVRRLGSIPSSAA